MVGRGIVAIAALALLAVAGASRAQHSKAIPPVPGLQPPADLVIRGGRVVTMDDRVPEGGAIAIRDGRVVGVGPGAMAGWVGRRTPVIELPKGALVIPGFIESHGHLENLGLYLRRLRLLSTKSWDEVVAGVDSVAKVARPGEWILGRGWHQEKWSAKPARTVEGFPTLDELDRVAPDHPVFLIHASGTHGAIANTRALQRAGIDRNTPDPPGGHILRDASGALTGVLRETAVALVQKALDQDLARRSPEEIDRDVRDLVARAEQECLSKGVTTFRDAGADAAMLGRYRRIAEEGGLRMRLWCMASGNPSALGGQLDRLRVVGAANDHFTVRAIKIRMDGALGSRGAWLLEPYSDLPGHTGLNTAPLESLAVTAALARDHHYQLCVHAIGDRGNREALDLFERTLGPGAGALDHRWRIEHAQHLAAADIPRFGKLGVIASMQGVHCTSDAPWVDQRLGSARAAEGAYVWQKLKKSGAVIVNGTDAPVEDVSPVASFHASVSRRLADGRVWYPDQRMTRMEALRSYTRDAAWGGFEERFKGRLAPGMLADVTVLSRDILTIPEAEIPSAQVLYTIVGGRVAFERPAVSVKR